MNGDTTFDQWLDTDEGQQFAQAEEQRIYGDERPAVTEPPQQTVCNPNGCGSCAFIAECEEIALSTSEGDAEPIHKCQRCSLHFGGEDTTCPRCDWPEPLPCAASDQCVLDNCRHFWYEGCDAGCNLKASPFYRPWPYGDDPDEDQSPTYCTMAEWSSRCTHNETGHTNYCAEVCELHPKFRVIE